VISWIVHASILGCVSVTLKQCFSGRSSLSIGNFGSEIHKVIIIPSTSFALAGTLLSRSLNGTLLRDLQQKTLKSGKKYSDPRSKIILSSKINSRVSLPGFQSQIQPKVELSVELLVFDFDWQRPVLLH
jgi:hypothetical protein